MRAFFSLCMLVAFSIQVNGQERFVHYPRNEQNRELYDTQVLSFYSMSVITGIRIAEEITGIDYTFGGMSKENVRRLEAQEARSHDRIPEMKWILGPQATTPLMSADGEDSLFWLADGTAEYVYPSRDTIFFITRHFDDFVLKQQLEKDPVTGAESWTNETICLRKRLFENEEPVVVLSFPWKYIYTVNKEYYIPIQPAVSDSLSAKLTSFLTESERLMGADYTWQYLPKGALWQYRYPFTSRFADDSREQEEWNLLLRTGEKNGVCLKVHRWEMPAVNEYGEDSVAFDEKGELHYIMHQHIDSLLYLESHFGRASALHTITYVEGTGWKSTVSAIVFLKEGLPKELPLIVYRTIRDERTNVEYSAERLEVFQYAEHNPLLHYMNTIPAKEIGPLDWEALSGHNRFLGIPIPHP